MSGAEPGLVGVAPEVVEEVEGAGYSCECVGGSEGVVGSWGFYVDAVIGVI